MNLVFIYGPPATGKLTVAKELSKQTGYPVFHNHLTRDLVQNVYPGNVMDHYDLVDALRDEVMRYCAAHGTDLIFTYVYDGPDDNEAVAKRVKTITENGGKVLFVELTAPHDVLLERVANESRKQHRKLVDPEILSGLLSTKEFPSVPYEKVFKIDTSKNSPSETAQQIIAHYELSRKES